MAIDDYWYKNAVLDCLNVATYMDGNADAEDHLDAGREGRQVLLSPLLRTPAAMSASTRTPSAATRTRSCEVLDAEVPVLVLRYAFRGASMVTLHNFSDQAQTVRVKLRDRLFNLLSDEHSHAGRGAHEIALDGYGFRWYRVGRVDETLIRGPF